MSHRPIFVRDGSPLSHGEIARGTGLHVSSICKIVNRKRRMSLKTAIKIAAFLGLSVEQLNDRIGHGA